MLKKKVKCLKLGGRRHPTFLHCSYTSLFRSEERLTKQDKEASGKHEQTIKRTVATLHELKKKKPEKEHNN